MIMICHSLAIAHHETSRDRAAMMLDSIVPAETRDGVCVDEEPISPYDEDEVAPKAHKCCTREETKVRCYTSSLGRHTVSISWDKKAESSDAS